MKNVYKVQIIIFCLCISPLLFYEFSIKAGFSLVSILPYPQFYSNVLGPHKPNVAAPAYWNPQLKYKYSTSRDGFRENKSHVVEPNGRSVLCLGDSFTFGIGVNDSETYPSYLEEILNADGRQSFRVLNAGAMAIGIKQYVEYYKANRQKLKSDIVVVQFNIYDLHTLRDKSLVNKGEYDKLKDFGNRDGLQLFLSAFVLEGPFYQFLISTPAFPSFEKSGHDELAKVPLDNKFLLDESSYGQVELLWKKYYENLLELRDLVESNGSRMLVVIVPERDQIYDYVNGPSAAVVPFCKENNIDCLDMTPIFRDSFVKNSTALYLDPWDVHCTKEGNFIIAREIYKYISLGSHNGNNFFDYRNPCKVEGQFSENGELRLQPNSYVKVVESSAQGVAVKGISGGGVHFIHSSSDSEVGSNARYQFEFLSKVRQVGFVLFPHKEQETGGGDFTAIARLSKNEWKFSTADSNNQKIWLGIDTAVSIECENSDPNNRTVELNLHLTHKAGLVLDKKHGPGAQRRFEILLYPEP